MVIFYSYVSLPEGMGKIRNMQFFFDGSTYIFDEHMEETIVFTCLYPLEKRGFPAYFPGNQLQERSTPQTH